MENEGSEEDAEVSYPGPDNDDMDEEQEEECEEEIEDEMQPASTSSHGEILNEDQG